MEPSSSQRRKANMRAALYGVILLSAAMAGLSQSPPAQPPVSRPAFEVATVRLNTAGIDGSTTRGTSDQVVFTNHSLRRLIERAYKIQPSLLAAPPWIDSVRVDITAKYPPGTPSEDRLLMLRTLLEDRFKLVFHRTPKEVPGYALMVSKGGFKLKPSAPGSRSVNDGGGRIRFMTARNTSIGSLADELADTLGEIVIDKTGIEGVYDFDLRWTRDDLTDPSGPVEQAPSIFTALQDTLGLHLERQKGAG